MSWRSSMFLTCLLFAGSSFADVGIPPVESPSPAKKVESPAQPAPAKIPPSLALILQGDAAFLARDFPSARALYQLAIKQDPQLATAHLRMAQLHLSQAEFQDASAVLETALRFVGEDTHEKAQAYFLKAMTLEGAGQLEEAELAWNTFATFAQATAPADEVTTNHAASGATSARKTPPSSAEPKTTEANAVSPNALPPKSPPPARDSAESAPEGSSEARHEPVSEATASQDVEPPSRNSGAPPVFAGTVAARKHMILARQKTVKESTVVRERIKKRFEEAQAKASK